MCMHTRMEVLVQITFVSIIELLCSESTLDSQVLKSLLSCLQVILSLHVEACQMQEWEA